MVKTQAISESLITNAMDDNAFKNTILKDIWRFLTNRLLILAVVIAASFYFLTATLFDLQIVNGKSYLKAVAATYKQYLPIVAARGTIYDKFGRPLALNSTAYSVKIDPSKVVSDAEGANAMLYALIQLFEANGQKYVDDFPISLHEPYEFEWSENRGNNWKRDMTVPEDATAYETIAYLRGHFKIDPGMDALEARKLLSLRSQLYMQRFSQYKTITVAYNVGTPVIIALEEHGRDFGGVFVDVEALREYPAGQYVSHMIGYIGKITEDDYAANKDKGYTNVSMFGRSGLERSFEQELRGVNGERVVETNALGIVDSTSTLETTPPVQGSKIFLTIDSVKQEKYYHMLEDHLRDILKSKIQGRSSREKRITVQEVLIALVNANTISLRDILDAEPESDSYGVRAYILSAEPEASVSQQNEDERNEAVKTIKGIVAEGINSGKIKPLTMLMVLLEQGRITVADEYLQRMKLGRITPQQVILDKLDSKELTPQMLNLDPGTGSVVVLDVKTGAVIVAVGYPTYDNNEFVNNFNNEYYQKQRLDPTTPMRNRPFMEARAPGSTFKMLSAITALENGSITARTTIYDELSFQKAGRPFTRCHAGSSHGSINVVSALAVSCNYFFCDALFRMGDGGIGALNRYMTAFGLNDRAGVEIYESADEIKDLIARARWPADTPIISSPPYKEFSMKLYNPDVSASDYTWYAGDTVKSSIGQANNQYSALTMAKYVATLATGGVRYQAHLLDRITTQRDEPVRTFTPVTEHVVELSPETLDTIYQGMLAVTETPRGTAFSEYRNFPIRVAGKTGTAQESSVRNDHSSFAAFAPFDEPQIAVYVQLPFGDTAHFSLAAASMGRQIIADYMGFDAKPEYAEPTNVLAR